MENTEKEKIGEALLKVALGYQVAEVTEEYAEVDGKLKLTKRKRTKKDVPPDLKAVQILLAENGGKGLESMSDAELEEEKKRLLQMLSEKGKGAGQVCVEADLKGETVADKDDGEEEEKKRRKPRAKPRKRIVRKGKTEVEK